MTIDLTIRRPGAYDLPMAAYHSQVCDAPSISSSGLRRIRETTPAHFWAYSNLNPDRFTEESTKALDFGKAAHSLLIEGKLPEEEFALTPFSGPFNRNDDKNGYKAGEKQIWKAEQEAAGLAIVTAEDLRTITEMAEALGRHPLVRDGILKGEVERSLFWRPDFDVASPIWLKSRPDVVPHDDIIVNYKTAESAAAHKMVSATADRGYHISEAMAVDAIRAIYGREIKHCTLLVQEKKPPYVVANRPLDESYIIAGRMEYQRAARTFAECLKRNEWPGYPDETLYCPGWLDEKLKREGEAA